ncbi:MAG TPA: chondroitinase-B domain-containing protein, partial [Modestobacter sp.]|nr:chondroitinase-B domain-containing protein [Modestobacter sp.]
MAQPRATRTRARSLALFASAAAVLTATTVMGGIGSASAAPATSTTQSASAAAAAATTKVRTAAELTAALRSAKPGQVIELADGTYKGTFKMTTSGTASKPIVLRGGRGAVLDGGDPAHLITVQLQGADFWRLEGFSVRGAQKGVVLDDSNKNVLSQLDISKSGMEAVHFRSSSSDNRLENSR